MVTVDLDARPRRVRFSLGRAIAALLARRPAPSVLRPDAMSEDRLRDLGLRDLGLRDGRGGGASWGRDGG